MQKADITSQRIYIKKIINVICSENRNRHKTTYVTGRHSDALIYILQGSCTYTFDGGECFTVKQGDVLYLAHGANYSMLVGSESYKVIFCDFEFDMCEPRRSGVWSPEDTDYVKSLFSRLYKSHSSNATASFAESLSLLYSIYAAVIAIGAAVPSAIPERAKQFILEHINDPELSVYLLAEKSGVSEVYLRRTFNQAFGTSPAQFIVSERIKKAKSLMKYPFISLESCAMQSGFSSLQYFCRVFKAQTGISPSKYRKKEYGI